MSMSVPLLLAVPLANDPLGVMPMYCWPAHSCRIGKRFVLQTLRGV